MAVKPRWVIGTGLLVLGIVLGSGSAWWRLTRGSSYGQGAGPWRVSLLAGSADADAVTRARVARGGLLALKREETMYYVATTDSAGRALRSRCHYRISGQAPAARWWSLTAYAEDFHLFADPLHRYSVGSENAAWDGSGRFLLETGPDRRLPTSALASAAATAGNAGNTDNTAGTRTGTPPVAPTPWLPTPGDRGLVLTLRVYNPSVTLQQAQHRWAGPEIVAIGGCVGEPPR